MHEYVSVTLQICVQLFIVSLGVVFLKAWVRTKSWFSATSSTKVTASVSLLFFTADHTIVRLSLSHHMRLTIQSLWVSSIGFSRSFARTTENAPRWCRHDVTSSEGVYNLPPVA